MSDKIVITITDGNFEQGFDIKVDVGRNTDEQHGRLPPQPEIPALYRKNFSDGTLESDGKPRSNNYQTWVRAITHDTESLPIVSQNLYQNTTLLETKFTDWLSFADLGNIQTQIGRTIRPGSQPQVILQVPNDRILHRLPWHKWAWFNKHFPDTEIVLSRRAFKVKPFRGLRRVLVIVGTEITTDRNGNERRIDLTPDLKALQTNLMPVVANVDPLLQPSLKDLRAAIRTGKYHIIFYVGHSNGDDGSIGVNRQENITINDLNDEIRAAATNGLEMMLLNSCNGSEIAFRLSEWNVPYIIVMRERIANDVAVTFIEHFSQYLSEGHSLTKSVSKARQQLRNQEGVQRCASWMPMIFQSGIAPDYVPFPKLQVPKLRVKLLEIFRFLSKLYFWKKVAIVSLITLLTILITFYALVGIDNGKRNTPHSSATEITCNSNLKYLSCGQKSVLYENSKYFNEIERQNMEVMTSNNIDISRLKKVVENLELSWKSNQKNPEILIAWSNAKIKLAQWKAIEKNLPPPVVKTIAVLVPASLEDKYLPISLLAAVAEAQREWNNDLNSHSWSLEVLFGDDHNDPTISRTKVVKEILEKRMIVGTLGPYSSYVAEGILPQYKSISVLITGTSTAYELGKGNSSFIRTVNSNDVQADSIIEFLKHEKIKKIEMLHGTKIYSTTFAEKIKTKAENAGILFASAPLTKDSLSTIEVFRGINNRKSQVIILIPDAFTNRQDRENAHQIIIQNAGKTSIIGNEIVNEPWLYDQIKQTPELGKNLMFTLPWNDAVDKKNISLEKYNRAPQWWQNKNGQISHRTVLTYDAANVLIKSIDLAVKQEVSNLDIRAKLPTLIREVKHVGITGEITFDGNDRHESLQGLVQPVFDPSGKFVEFKAPKIANLS